LFKWLGNNEKTPLPGLLSGNETVEFELSKPHSAPKHPFINSKQKEGKIVQLINIQMYMNTVTYRFPVYL
jgi:hypothetical protein